jgi:hypothetical protein
MDFFRGIPIEMDAPPYDARIAIVEAERQVKAVSDRLQRLATMQGHNLH